MKVSVGSVSRVVGHIALDVTIRGDDVDAKLRILNDARFIEALVVGRRFDEVPEIASRICGPCGVSHTLASITALEKAMKVEPPEDVCLLREVLCHGVNIQNQTVHLYFLALPDYIGCGSLAELVKKHPEIVKTGLKLKTYGNKLVEAIGGRMVHPNACIVGGFTKTPSKEKIEATIKVLKEAKRYALETADLFLKLDLPELNSPNNLHLATASERAYPFIGDMLSASDGSTFPSADYEKFIEEEPRTYTTSKYCRLKGSSFYVGSRARLNIYRKGLSESAEEYASKIEFPLKNPFENIPAKAIEILHCIDASMEILEDIKDRRLKTNTELQISSGEGVGTLEAPRGVLIHHYQVDRQGVVRYANIITPTALNGNHIEESLESLVKENMELEEDELKFNLERLIRAYDPCLGCATHLVEIKMERV